MKHFENGLIGPIVECFYCGKQITEAGNVVWRWSVNGESPDDSFDFTHKQCDGANEAQDNFPHGEELDTLLEVSACQRRAHSCGMVQTKRIRLRFTDGSERSVGDDDAKRLAVLLQDELEHGATYAVAVGIEHELALRFGTRLPVDVPERSALGVTKALGELWQ